MTQKEKAWQTIESEWNPHSARHSKNEGESLPRLQSALRSLMQMKLSVTAIEQITKAIHFAHLVALENSWCENCGVRSDGMDECSQCKQMVHVMNMDSFADICHDCQETNEEEE